MPIAPCRNLGRLPARLLILGPLLFGLCLSQRPAAAADAAPKVHYLEQTGERHKTFTLALEPGPPLQLAADGPGERHLTVMAADYSTRRWQLTKTDADTEILARREGNRLLLSGRLRGEKIERSLPIDAAPWFQALSFSLRNLLDPRIEALEFWTLRPDTLEVHKLRAVRRGTEALEITGRPVAAWRIEVRLSGLKALFWHSHYWLRQSDGVFLRYRGPSGPPGAPLTEVRWAGEE